MERKKLVIIDGSSLLYRAYFALPPLTTADGTPTQAVYGFTMMLVKLLEEERPDVLLLALEGGKTFRHAEFAEYKAQRPRTPDELAVQTPIAREMAEAFQVPILQQSGFEADDVIGTVSSRAPDAGFNVIVVTGDLDALQLVNDRVSVLVNRKGVTETQRFDLAAVRERFGLAPDLLPDFKALKGDSSDNIPGIPGIGDKTAAALLNQYGSLEGLLESAGEVKAPRIRANLLEGRQKALLYKRLATICRDLPLATPFETWSYLGPDLPKVQDLCCRLEFRTLARRLAEKEETSAGRAAQGTRLTLAKLEEPKNVRRFAERARRVGTLAIRTLLSGAEGRGAVLRGIAISAAGETAVFGGDVGDGELMDAKGTNEWILPAPIRELLEDPSVFAFGHDLKRDLHALAGHGVTIGKMGFDTALAAYVLNPGRSSYRLEDITREILQLELPSQPGPARCAAEAAAIAGVHETLAQRLKDSELERVYYDLEIPLMPILARLEQTGLAVNRDELRRLSEHLAVRVAAAEARAYAVIGRSFNLGSPKQLKEILFTELGLPAGKKTKTGYSTDSDVLQDLAAIHPLPELILEYRELSRLKSAYADALQNLIDPNDGRVHTHLNQMVAATGRLSSSDPNLQNIPVRTEVGREIRSTFVPGPGMKLLSADYSQIELRLMAHITRDPELLRAFSEQQDVHAATAAQVFRVPLAQVSADQRRRAKTVNFAVLYGQREFGLSRQLRIDVTEARKLIDAYFKAFPGVFRFAEQTLKSVRTLGYVTTLPPFRRRRYIPGIHAGNRNERLAAEREAVNAPIQGTAADVIKAAMIRVAAAMEKSQLQSRMLLQVHDELLFEIVPEEEARMVSLVRKEMENAYSLDVPLEVEIKVGCNWRDVESTAD